LRFPILEPTVTSTLPLGGVFDNRPEIRFPEARAFLSAGARESRGPYAATLARRVFRIFKERCAGCRCRRILARGPGGFQGTFLATPRPIAPAAELTSPCGRFRHGSARLPHRQAHPRRDVLRCSRDEKNGATTSKMKTATTRSEVHVLSRRSRAREPSPASAHNVRTKLRQEAP
jgi:hypothetical protein